MHPGQEPLCLSQHTQHRIQRQLKHRLGSQDSTTVPHSAHRVIVTPSRVCTKYRFVFAQITSTLGLTFFVSPICMEAVL